MNDPAVSVTRVQTELDLSRPSPARLYDCFLGGKNNFAVDREAAEKIRRAFPALADAAWANRGFHGRAAAWMACRGITQFIDIGCGLPTMGNTHEVVQRLDAGARVVYADNDHQVVVHAGALLADGANTTVIHADLRDPFGLLHNAALRARIDLNRPCGVLATAVAHFIADAGDPWQLAAQMMSALAPGSYLALSHATADAIPAKAIRAGREVYQAATQKIHLRTRAEVERFFATLKIVPPYPGARPNVCHVGLWGCQDPVQADSDGSRALYAAVGRRP